MEINPQVLILFLRILFNWWFAWLPVVLFYLVREFYLWWKNERWYAGIQWVTMEIKLPEEVLKTPKAMEQVFHGLHGIHDPLNWKEKWIDGRMLLWLSLEIVGINGTVHFYIHVPKVFQKMLEANIFSQYPDAEIMEVGDYTKNIPQDTPSKNWDLWGTDFRLDKPDVYPLRTYKYFETEMMKEETKVDPLASLLELMSSLQEGEQLWIQILARPIIEERNWKADGQKVINKIIGKKEEKKKSFISQLAGEMSSVLLSGKPTEEKKAREEELYLMWKLTPGEQDVLKAIEENISKYGFESNIRFIYLARTDVFAKPKGVASVFGIFKQFGARSLNALRPDKTKTKVVYGWGIKDRRIRLRKRKLLRLYKLRWFPIHRKAYILNTEELATLYHFPGRIVAPAPFVERIAAKKGEPPAALPI